MRTSSRMRAHLAAAGIDGVDVGCGDGGLGHPAGAPYDRIVLTVGAWDLAPAWWDQLAAGGRLLAPCPCGACNDASHWRSTAHGWRASLSAIAGSCAFAVS